MNEATTNQTKRLLLKTLRFYGAQSTYFAKL